MYQRTPIPGLIADVRVEELKNGKIRAKATAIDQVTDAVVDEVGTVFSRSLSSRFFAACQVEAIARLTEKYRKVFGIEEIEPTADDMMQAFEVVKTKVFEDHLHLAPRWNCDRTNTQAITFFERNTLPYLYPFTNPNKRRFLPVDRNDIESQLVAAIQGRNGNNEPRAIETAQLRLREADIIYAHMRATNDPPILPKLKLSRDIPIERMPKPEQVKYLPPQVLAAFFRVLVRLLPEDPKFVFFAVLVVMGLRPAEAAAVKPSDIVFNDDKTFCTVMVSHQEQDGKLEQRLKNKYSRRLVVIPKFGTALLGTCCELIGEIYPHDDRAMNIATECAAQVKTILLDLLAKYKLDSDLLVKLGEEVDDDDLDPADSKDKTGALRATKIGCYVLRRVFAGTMRNIMGFTTYETDRMLGHVPVGFGARKFAKIASVDINNIDVQRAIAQKMERYIYLPQPEYSLNPSIVPINAEEYKESGEVLHLLPYTVCRIKASTDCTLDLCITGAEAAEAIDIVLPAGKYKLAAASTERNWEGVDRVVIGKTVWRDDIYTEDVEGDKDG